MPTESEWEYAARAKTTTARFWGDNPTAACQYANVDDGTHNCKDGYQFTAPVGTFKPNDFGTYDMLGNVWEWVQDCYHENYEDAPTDGSAWGEQQGGDCAQRVIRGGSWFLLPRFVRSAYRYGHAPGLRYNSLGFRLAQDI
ncbi:MAG: formylglycine-generating enzyme family protein [Gammaproteobacteria bacterium]